MDAAIREIRTDIFAAQVLSPLNDGFVPWTMPALRPGAMATILNDIAVNHRMVIVECGGGVSTIYIARLLRQLGIGHLYTIEHEVQWIEMLSEMVSAEKDYVSFIHAPIMPLQKIRAGDWYDVAPVLSALNGHRIDLLIVDGPSATLSDPMIRYTAMPMLKHLFSDDFAVVLDDVNRKGEQSILHAWQKELDLKFHIVSHAAIGLSSVAYKSFIG